VGKIKRLLPKVNHLNRDALSCERFSCLPSALAQEDAMIFRMVRLVDEERRWAEGDAGGGE
jgi:hypothetical protein